MYFDKFRKMGLGKDECYRRIGEILGRSQGTIGVAIRRLTPTKRTARLYLESKAYKLARRVVEKANTQESIDLLSRMGVLDPPAKAEGSSMGGFFLTVTAETCGAVKVGMAVGQIAEKSESVDVFDVDPIEQEATHEAAEVIDQSPARSFTKSGSTQDAIRDAKIRLGLARQRGADRRVGAEFKRLQGAHVSPQVEDAGAQLEDRSAPHS